MSKFVTFLKNNAWVGHTNHQIGEVKSRFCHLVKKEFDYSKDQKTFSSDYTGKTYDFNPIEEDWMTMARYFQMVAAHAGIMGTNQYRHFNQVMDNLHPNILLDANGKITSVKNELLTMAPKLKENAECLYSKTGDIPINVNYAMADVVRGKRKAFYRVLISVPRDLADIKLAALTIETDNKYWVRLNDTLFRDGELTFAVKWVNKIPSVLLNSKIR